MNYIWLGIILISFIFGALTGRLNDVVNAIFSGAKSAIDVVIILAGIMTFWLGIMKIAEKSGIVNFISKLLQPIAKLLFPEIPKGDRAIGDIAMNFSANALGLSNAATPMGLKAMERLQELNKDKNSASNSMCMLLSMNTAGFQLIPATVIAILAANGAKNPTEIIVPTLIVTSCAFVCAIICARICAKLCPPQKDSEVSDNA